ncbi:two-component regulator propeller domain-containing protein [Bacteroides sp. CR5/BHMF/2]|nr:two-component regulator propeller domain-containing protein [Bacteroides sp. CR5/BHMF/2]
MADGDYIWAATRSDGLYRYNYITGMLDQYKFSAKDVSSISNNNVSTSFKDTQGRFWFGTFGEGYAGIFLNQTLLKGTIKRTDLKMKLSVELRKMRTVRYGYLH